MSQLNGFFSLRTPRDLLAKLEADYLRITSAESLSVEAQYAAFDFFVTAEHLAEWSHHATGKPRAEFTNYSDAALVSHIANGAKHFIVNTNRHVVAKDTHATVPAFEPGVFEDAFVIPLVIKLEDGTAFVVSQVALRVLKHWRQATP